MLRLAACLEEHFPHSMANAVVQAARERGLPTRRCTPQVEYLVAHGIASTVDGRRVIIGSAHFVFEDEGCTVPPGEQDAFDALPKQYSHLYLAVGGVLAAVICISDPLRVEAVDAVAALHDLGVGKIVMLTGDSERTAAAIAAQVGVDEYRAEVLPEDKARFCAGRARTGPHGGHDRRWNQRLPGSVRCQCGHRNQRWRRHRPGDRGHHHRGKRPVRTGAAAAAVRGPDEPHPV